MSKKSRLLILISFILCILMVFNSCGMSKGQRSSNGKTYTSPAQTKSSSENKVSAPTLTDGTGAQNSSNSSDSTAKKTTAQDYGKIIVTKDVLMETLTFDNTVKGIMNDIMSSGGYIENSDINGRGIEDSKYVENRTATIKARIPKDKFTAVSDGLEKYGTIVRTSIQSQNVTDQYFDAEARIKTKKVREERLLDLLKKSGNLQDIITLENELSNVRLEIETLTGSLRNMDNLVDYSTMTINIREVKEPTEIKEKPITLWQRIKDGFMSAIDIIVYAIKNILILVAFLIPFIIIALIIYLLCRYVWKIPIKHNKDKDKDKDNNKDK